MPGALFVVSIVSLLTAAAITLAIAGLVLQRMQRYVELAEGRMEVLREGQERLLSLLEEKGLEKPAVSRTEIGTGHPEKEADGKMLEDLREKVRRLEVEVQDLQSPAGRVKVPSIPSLSREGQTPEATRMDPLPVREETTQTTLRTEDPRDERPDRALKHLHPDDDVIRPGTPNVQDSTDKTSPSKKMFSEHYDRYLENYEGYVKLAERIYEMRQKDSFAEGSPAKQEWEQKLNRANDGIRRTTARLDILEQYYPELASDRRISHRANIAQNHLKLEEKLSDL